MADEVTARVIVPSIAFSQVGRYLSQAELQPHRSKYWLNTKEKDPEVLQQQVEMVCQMYLEARTCICRTVSIDGMPELQALELIANTIPMQPGRPERIELPKHSSWLNQIEICSESLGDVLCDEVNSPR